MSQRRPSSTLSPIQSGTDRSWRAGFARAALAGLSGPYAAAVRVRNLLYDVGAFAATRLDVPVISVGNLTTGGTGKTPVVAWLCQQLVAGGHRPGIASRGYRALADGRNDESLVLAAECPGVPQELDRDRIRGGRTLAGSQHCDVVVLDDGLQHRRLARDLEIVLIDATEPWGFGHLLPRGLLREPLSALGRAHLVCITRADQISTDELTTLREQIARWTQVPVVTAYFRPAGFCKLGSNTEPQSVSGSLLEGSQSATITISGQTGDFRPLALDCWRGATVLGFCGLGNPTGFERTLSPLVGQVHWQRFSDHHHFTPAELLELARLGREHHVAGWVCTLKDLVKLPAVLDQLRREGDSDTAALAADFAQRLTALLVRADFGDDLPVVNSLIRSLW